MKIPLHETFNFKAAITDYGWWMLSPNDWHDEECLFYRPIRLSRDRNLLLCISKHSNHLMINTETEMSLDHNDMKEIKDQVSWMFRLQDSFEPFYALCHDHEELLHIPANRKGRLLRSPSLFEDVVKVILTTNTRWKQTMNMVSNLVNGLGESVKANHQNEFKTFPTPERVLEAGESYLKEHVRVGYRSAYIIDAATKALDPVFDLESYKVLDSDITKLKEIKGVGPYAFNTLAMILGKYDLLPVDSEYKAHVIKKYFNGKKPTKQKLESVYDKWGSYKFLAYWYDIYS
ncbi:DNA-3-methyladenine glycosylase family protein [Amphibacillus sp. Q70]|uniref:DNA-3-methyladenine glycosylase family protein n=1 Tax=Amphibacillus sp. Q70 TaxID=3453416 RepID=UPI003F854ABC